VPEGPPTSTPHFLLCSLSIYMNSALCFFQKSRDVGRLLLRIKNVKATAVDWLSLQQTLVTSSIAKEHLLLLLAGISGSSSRAPTAGRTSATAPSAVTNREPFLLMQLISDASKQELAVLQASLATVVDWEASKQLGRVSVHAGVDNTLDQYRQTFAGT
jgi:hypothetical protein